MVISNDIRQEMETVIETAYRVSADVGRQVEEVLRDGRERPLSHDEAYVLLKKTISTLRQSSDKSPGVNLEEDVNALVERIIQEREQGNVFHSQVSSPNRQVVLQTHNGIQPSSVYPRPCFHETEIPMRSGFVNTADIKLWDGNERLDIHLGQFRQKYGRGPTPDELLDIMLSRTDLPGRREVPGLSRAEMDDQFKIVELASSIANNGVRKPPIIDQDGTLLDGNRRVAACYYVLHSDEFTSEQKQRAGKIFVWQLTEFATDDERRAVVVSLNFEPDCKEPWPEYVRARKVYEVWQTMLALETRQPGPQRMAEMKRELSRRFALGKDTATVNRYLKMVEWADRFEEYHINQKGHDPFEVKHRADRYIQYFDEMAKGATNDGLASTLNQDDGFRYLVFDLLFDGKFSNWKKVRDLKYVRNNEEAREALERARAASDPDIGEEHLDNALAIARAQDAAQREIGANTRIESFVKWLEALPVRAFRDQIRSENLQRLLDALKLVEEYVKKNLTAVSN